MADALTELLRARRRGKTMVLLEHTAGQGTSVGGTFEQLATIIAHMNDHPRVGVCLDTCHLLASGYDVCSPEGYTQTFKHFGRTIGFDRLKVFHLNDSKRPLGRAEPAPPSLAAARVRRRHRPTAEGKRLRGHRADPR